MGKINIQTSKEIVPKIYAYSTPEVPKHNGWTKIGYTEREDVMTRINEQTHTVGLTPKLEWYGEAVFDGKDRVTFKDTDFHAFLRKQGYEYEDSARNEWFKLDGVKSKEEFDNFKSNHGVIPFGEEVLSYTLRDEQDIAVEQTRKYFMNNKNGEFLWNAKPRFGKTLAAYDFIKQIKAKKVLIVTNRPAIANSWYEDYVKFMGDVSGFKFVSETESLKGKKYVLSMEKYITLCDKFGCIEFVSLQDLKGSVYFGGSYDKLKEISDLVWDVLIVDEAHEGVDTYKTDVAFDRIKRAFTLHLSGTAFKAIANDKFNETAIFNWTYADEQRAKLNWDNSRAEENPYACLPKLNLFTYQMSEIVKDIVEKGLKIGEEIKEYAFDLNEFFATNSEGSFIYDEAVTKFLDSLTKLEKMPFSTEVFRSELKHTFWLLNRVDSARALVKKLKIHPVFKDYKIILAAGDGKIDDSDATEKSYNKVKEAMQNNDKTITVSVGQLTTGVTVPEWTGVLMLSNVKSPSLYMQSAFRAQNPCLFKDSKGNFYRKENAYVFDFDPARTLIIFEEFANDLYSNTSSGRGTSEDRKKRVYELLNFFPVIGEDDNGEMVELDAEKVLSIPRRIKSREVVKHGFMSDFLFANISNIFHAPSEVISVIEGFEAISKPKNSQKIERQLVKVVEDSLNADDEVQVEDKYIIGKSAECFGDKIYKPIEDVSLIVSDILSKNIEDKAIESKKVKVAIKETMIKPAIDIIQEHYGTDLKAKDVQNISKVAAEKVDKIIDKVYSNFEIDNKCIEVEKAEELKNCETSSQRAAVEKKYDLKQEELKQELISTVEATQTEIADIVKFDTISTIEVNKKEKDKKDVEIMVRDHLRGFSRTIPSFLMAYGDENTTLSNFDRIVPDNVFKEVTGITLDQFRFLRDGGMYDDDYTGEYKHFKGSLFDAVVFNDSVKEFMALKFKLSNYFDEDNSGDIFDYIPPQKTNQIFTPKGVVIEMINLMEDNNPGCFDDDTNTFADFYMKSGLYITEIVKRLYRSKVMQSKYPDRLDRLKHIFKYQVYGCAPTEIIYRIILSYILGFDKSGAIKEHNLIYLDTKPLAEKGILNEEIDKVFGVKSDG